MLIKSQNPSYEIGNFLNVYISRGFQFRTKKRGQLNRLLVKVATYGLDAVLKVQVYDDDVMLGEKDFELKTEKKNEERVTLDLSLVGIQLEKYHNYQVVLSWPDAQFNDYLGLTHTTDGESFMYKNGKMVRKVPNGIFYKMGID